MLDQVKAKLQAEIDASKDNAYVVYVGQFLIAHIKINPQDAGKIMAADKTIAKSLDEMRKVAEKKKIGNMAMLTPNEGLAIVLKYFGIESKPAIPDPSLVLSPAVTPTAPATAPAAAAQSGSGFSVSLDEFGL